MTPIFLLSLPRSGSTLLQRILASHPDIATKSEPWVLLPFFAPFEPGLCKARYGQHLLEQAVTDLCTQLPNGSGDYDAAVRMFTDHLYGVLAAQKNARFFLDKTPRYHLIAGHLLRAFPDARFIILWRNPIATLASRIQSYGGKWRAQNYHVDLQTGLKNLVDVFVQNRDKILPIRYEDLITQTLQIMEKVYTHIGVSLPDCLEPVSATDLGGRMGDQTGCREYTAVSTVPASKWTETMGTPVRKAWCRRYLRGIGRERLAVMGYDLDLLLREIDMSPTRPHMICEDLARLAWARLRRLYDQGMS